MTEDETYMHYALDLARLGKGWVNPNPQVGAVIVKNGRIIGEGYHERYGGLHAERNAFKNLTESAKGATLYVALEPCAHTGHQPPCFEAIITHQIKRVVIGHFDPNPLIQVLQNGSLLAQHVKMYTRIGRALWLS
ncbi:bifunctional diaminohydroxyphosphoribosylaminopyrimidine deaminase/5-amino-6-(5-phosphoribosylamino)uracil reductase RibD [Lactococcus carnosus]|uniref:bifunctional diaminohydroxyphosphoribosylaminopyrimidine deaminase/5-amino-6-(5-phosphoribosylamino)uracil reductase RibD n=1 Tax=Pseudolactococcus carnosus TaxID=2749961 RepID=UPI003B97B9E4